MPVGERHIERKVGGNDVQFRKLTAYDRRDLLCGLKKQKRASLLDDLKAAGADKSEILGELRAFDDEKFGETQFVEYVNTLDGQTAVFDRSLDEQSDEQRASIRKELILSQSESLQLAAEICNLMVDTAPDDAASGPEGATYGDGGEPANPTPPEPETYQAPATT